MNEHIKALLKRMEERKQALMTEAETSEDVSRLKAINIELDELNRDIATLTLMQTADDKDDPDGRTRGVNTAPPAPVKSGAEKRTDDGEDMEYRKAFMNYVLKKTPIPAELRDDASTTTSGAGALVRTTLVNRMIQKMESFGMIVPLVTRTAYPGGVNIPATSGSPGATWVNEGASSDRQAYTASSIS